MGQKILILFILISFFSFAQAAEVSKILPNNPIFFIKKIYLNLKEKLITDPYKKFDFYWQNFLQAKKDFLFLVENSSDWSKSLDYLRQNFYKLKNHLLFSQLDSSTIMKVKLSIVDDLKRPISLPAWEDFLIEERNFLLDLVSKDNPENNLKLIEYILHKPLTTSTFILAVNIKEIILPSYENELTKKYLKILPPFDEVKPFLLTNQLDKWQIDFLLDYFKKDFLEKKLDLNEVAAIFEKINPQILGDEKLISEFNFWLNWIETTSTRTKWAKVDKNNLGNLFSLIQELTTPKPVCVYVWKPVCGIDGKTYANLCFLNLAKVKMAYEGSCVKLDDLEKEIQEIQEPEEWPDNFPEIEEFE